MHLYVELVHVLKERLDAVLVAALVEQEEPDLRRCREGAHVEVVEAVHDLEVHRVAGPDDVVDGVEGERRRQEQEGGPQEPLLVGRKRKAQTKPLDAVLRIQVRQVKRRPLAGVRRHRPRDDGAPFAKPELADLRQERADGKVAVAADIMCAPGGER